MDPVHGPPRGPCPWTIPWTQCIDWIALWLVCLWLVLNNGNGNTTYTKNSKTLPLWNLYFHLPAVNTTSSVIQGHFYDLLSIVLETNDRRNLFRDVRGDPLRSLLVCSLQTKIKGYLKIDHTSTLLMWSLVKIHAISDFENFNNFQTLKSAIWLQKLGMVYGWTRSMRLFMNWVPQWSNGPCKFCSLKVDKMFGVFFFFWKKKWSMGDWVHDLYMSHQRGRIECPYTVKRLKL